MTLVSLSLAIIYQCYLFVQNGGRAHVAWDAPQGAQTEHLKACRSTWAWPLQNWSDSYETNPCELTHSQCVTRVTRRADAFDLKTLRPRGPIPGRSWRRANRRKTPTATRSRSSLSLDPSQKRRRRKRRRCDLGGV